MLRSLCPAPLSRRLTLASLTLRPKSCPLLSAPLSKPGLVLGPGRVRLTLARPCRPRPWTAPGANRRLVLPFLPRRWAYPQIRPSTVRLVLGWLR